MSFILDALKKVEKRKTGTGEIRVAEEVVVPRRSRRYLGAAMLLGIAVASAVVTAGAMRFFGTHGSAPMSAAEAPEAIEMTVAPIPDGVAEPEPQSEPEPGPGPGAELSPIILHPEAEPEAATAAAGVVSAARRATVGRSESQTPTPRGDATVEAMPGEPTPPPTPEPEPQLEPEPELVLQGTSVLNGEPVAVISDQRVFVGDRIAGAVVVSIEAGRVVLEREGERLELTL